MNARLLILLRALLYIKGEEGNFCVDFLCLCVRVYFIYVLNILYNIQHYIYIQYRLVRGIRAVPYVDVFSLYLVGFIVCLCTYMNKTK